MKMQSAVEEYLVEIEVRKYTPKTIRSYRCNLNLFLRFCAEKLHVETVEALTPAVVRQFSRCMSEAERKGTYINGVLKSIKSFIQYCYLLLTMVSCGSKPRVQEEKTAYKWHMMLD